MKKFFWVLITVLWSLNTISQSQFYESKTHQQVVKAFLDSDHKKLKKLLKKELSSSNPHSLTYTYVEKFVSDIDPSFLEELTTEQQAIVKFTKDIIQLNDQERKGDIYQKYKKCDFVEKLPPYILAVIASAAEEQSFDEFEKIVKLSLNKHGSHYLILCRLDIEEKLGLRMKLWKKIMSDNFYKKYPSIVSYVSHQYKNLPELGITNWRDYTRVYAIKEYLKSHPNDAVAYRRLAAHLKSLYRYDEAREAYLKSYALDPFYYHGSSLVDAASCAYFMDNQNQADKEISKFVGIHYPLLNSQEKFIQYSAKALFDGKDKTEARERLNNGIALNSSNTDYFLALANLEYDAIRYQNALSNFKKIPKNELRKHLTNYRKYLYTLQRAEEFEILLEELEWFFESEDLGNVDVFTRIQWAYYSLGQRDLELSTLEKGVENYPLNTSLISSLAYELKIKKRYKEAEELSRKAVAIHPFYSSDFSRIRDIKKAQNKSFEGELEKFFQDHPYSHVVLNELKKTKPKDQRIDFLKNLSAPFSLVKAKILSFDLKGQEFIDYSTKQLETAESSIDSLFHLNMLLAYDRETKVINKRTDSSAVQGYLKDMEAFYKLGANRDFFHNKRAYFYRSLGLKEKGLEEIKKAIKANPYKDWLISNSRIAFGNMEAYKPLRKLIEKNPYSYDSYGMYMKINTLYTGSNINTLWAYEKCKNHFPEKSCNSGVKNIASEKLGYPLARMEDYKNGKTIADGTKRYIGWYNQTRRKSWKNSFKKLIHNKVDNSVTIIDENGEESVIKDHPYFSKPTLKQKGTLWVKFEYNPEGNLKNINTSAGSYINLKYNTEKRISSLESSEDGTLLLDYNENGKTSRMIYGKDTVNVIYNRNNQIESIKSNGGHKVALKVTQIFSNLLKYVRNFSTNDIKVKDEKYESLREDFKKQEYTLNFELKAPNKAVIDSYKNFVVYLKNHLKNNKDYAGNAIRYSNVMLSYLSSDIDINLKNEIVPFSLYVHEILMKVRRLGVAQNYWNEWITLQETLELEKQKQKSLNTYRKSIEAVQKKFSENPIVLLKSAEWLPKSDLNNKAYWSSYDLSEIIPKYDFANTRINKILRRKNGDILITTNKGIALKKNGFWSFLYYDALNKKLLSNKDLIKFTSKLEFLDLIEISKNRLIVSTTKGIYKISNDYRSLKKFNLSEENYVGNSGCKLVWSNRSIIASNKSSINILKLNEDGSKIELKKSFSIDQGEEIKNIQKTTRRTGGLFVGNYMVQTSRGIYNLSTDDSNEIYSLKSEFKVTNIDDAEFSKEDGNLYYLDGNKLFKYNYVDSSKDLGSPIEVYSNIIKNKSIFGLLSVSVDDKTLVAVSTDEGINIFKNNHFELFKVPYKSGLDEYTDVSYGAKSEFGMLTKQKLISFSKKDFYYSKNKPSKIKFLEKENITLMLNRGRLYYSYNERIFNNRIRTDGFGTSIRDFDVTPEGDVYFTDSYSIYKLTFSDLASSKTYKTTKLFEIQPVRVDDRSLSNSSATRIKVGTDGTIWVTTKLSVFRYNRKLTPALKEFSYYKNSKEFPAKTLEVFNLIETFDNEIWAITSSESWNTYKGVELNGGLVVYNKEKDIFEYFDKEKPVPSFPWFIKSYTKIGDKEAILGTSLGFAYHGEGGIKTLRDIGNKSYLDIESKHKNLFLGTEGIKFGDMWLFGCGEGVVGYQDGQWMFADRLNQLLPEYAKNGQWGGNLVNTLAVDHLNRLNVSTDLGMVIIDANQISPVDLLIMSKDVNKAVEYHNIEKLRKEREIIVSGLPDDNDAKKTIDEVLKLENQKSDLEKLKRSFNKNYKVKQADFKTINVDSVDFKMKRISDRYSQLLLTLKEKNPVLYQTLRIPPLDIAGIRSKLKNDECVLQYIPLEGKLIIQVVSRQKTVLKEVNIKKKKLYNLALLASDILSNRKEIRGGALITKEDDKKVRVDLVLQELYNLLLSPVLNDLELYKNKVQIIAEGALNYIPFEALIYRDGKNKKHFAIEDYNFSYLSSMYMYQLLANLTNSSENKMLLMGDPDRSLPFARQEVESIAQQMPQSAPLIGKRATLKEFKKQSRDKDIIHLATHGFLDKKSVKDSWLLFADTKLRLSQVYEFNLDETDLMILSACETSLGKEGIETTTLSRAFANSGVQNLIASLWRVNDESTKILMTHFYEELNNGASYMDALKKAKQHLITYNNGQFKNPRFWAPFVLFGKS